MLSFPISPEKARLLARRMEELGVREDDLDEHFVTSGGKGGQNVNKVATCVVLLHRPTRTQVKCQEARTQGMNRYLARKLLLDKIEAARLGAASRKEQEAERIRRQKRRRSRRQGLRRSGIARQAGALLSAKRASPCASDRGAR